MTLSNYTYVHSCLGTFLISIFQAMARKKGSLDIIHFMNLSVMNFVELLKIVLISHVLGMAMLSNIHSQEEMMEILKVRNNFM